MFEATSTDTLVIIYTLQFSVIALYCHLLVITHPMCVCMYVCIYVYVCMYAYMYVYASFYHMVFDLYVYGTYKLSLLSRHTRLQFIFTSTHTTPILPIPPYPHALCIIYFFKLIDAIQFNTSTGVCFCL